MNSIQFFGAAGIVTGSCNLLTSDKGAKLLIDLGMFQGGDEIESLNYAPLGFDPSGLSGAVLTHAHLDHSGRLPLLTKNGYTGKIYMTEATRMLTALVLMDSAKIADENSRKNNREPLYTTEDVEFFLSKIETREYGQKFRIADFDIVFRDAGHILGSSAIQISDQSGKSIVFSGDLGNTPEDMIRPTENIKEANFVVMESTYGSRFHKLEDPDAVLLEEISRIEKNKGVLLIPSFSIERAQEILHRINHLKNENKISAGTQVFLDSPMSIKATEIFRKFPELYNAELSEEVKKDDPFDFPGLTVCQTAEESKEILLTKPPKVIISGSGMMHGGRVLHHAINYLPLPETTLLLVGYQAPGTLGHFLAEGLTRVRIFDKEVQVKARVRMIEAMSCHADQKKLLNWLGYIKGVEKVFLNHGEDDSRKSLAKEITKQNLVKQIILPQLGDKENLQ